jgi:hypothetical protein
MRDNLGRRVCPASRGDLVDAHAGAVPNALGQPNLARVGGAVNADQRYTSQNGSSTIMLPFYPN